MLVAGQSAAHCAGPLKGRGTPAGAAPGSGPARAAAHLCAVPGTHAADRRGTTAARPDGTPAGRRWASPRVVIHTCMHTILPFTSPNRASCVSCVKGGQNCRGTGLSENAVPARRCTGRYTLYLAATAASLSAAPMHLGRLCFTALYASQRRCSVSDSPHPASDRVLCQQSCGSDGA